MNTEIIYLFVGMLFAISFIKVCGVLSKKHCKHGNLHEIKPEIYKCTYCGKELSNE